MTEPMSLSTVLKITWRGTIYVVKASLHDSKHIRREIDAYVRFARVLSSMGHTPQLVHADQDAGVLVVTHLEGRSATDASISNDTQIHRSAGALLKLFHGQRTELSETQDRRENEQALGLIRWLHGTGNYFLDEPRAALRGYVPIALATVPTHGDFVPRNWLVDDRRVKVIDFGNFAFRPAASDLVRMSLTTWYKRDDLESAFFGGYGSDPRDRASWRVLQIRESVRLLAWAERERRIHYVGLGRTLLARALAD
jgi:thiamine kinase-like enzyme